MSGHTPGPWTVNEDCHVYGPQKRPTSICATVYKKADARLISAAPELLEASRNALQIILSLKNESFAPSVVNELKKAISKAEGGTI